MIGQINLLQAWIKTGQIKPKFRNRPEDDLQTAVNKLELSVSKMEDIAKQLHDEGRRLKAIRIIAVLHGCDLKRAKEFCESGFRATDRTIINQKNQK
jgi:hypothetical protein